MSKDLEALAAKLESSPDYRVLRRFVPPGHYHAPSGAPTATGLVVDVETTGLDPARDRIIEFCGVPFVYERDTGRILEVGPAATWLEDPGRAIPKEVTRLTGITDDMVRGKAIDEAAASRLAEGAGLVIAHNAAFDRPFVDRRLAAFKDKAWACSQKEIAWRELGASSAALEFLLLRRCGLFFDGHRADADCLALIHLLQQPFDDGTLPLQLLLASARSSSVVVWATGAAFDKKDILKQRRYRWSNGDGGTTRAWYKAIPASDWEAEQAWLREAVYDGREGWKTEQLDARRRYAG